MPIEFDLSYADPDVFLALSLSAPGSEDGSSHHRTQFLIEVDDDVRVTFPRSTPRPPRMARLLASKETIAFGLLLRRLSEMRRDESYLQSKLREFAHRRFDEVMRFEMRFLRDPVPTEREPVSPASFLASVDIAPDLLDDIDDLTHRVLRFLEDEGLVIDPWITGTTGVIVLLGMVPVRWSVRTPRGQRVYREISVRAGLWTLDIHKLRRGEKQVTDWEFHFRGVNAVRRLLRGLAEEYLAIEREDRQDRGKPNVEQPDGIEID